MFSGIFCRPAKNPRFFYPALRLAKIAEALAYL
jgi:hypothetical protein